MARELTRTERNYGVGVQQFPIDSFTRDDADALELVITMASWPPLGSETALFWITLAYDNGDAISFDITGPGTVKGTSTPTDEIRCTFPIIRTGDGTKKAVVGATVTVDVRVAIRCAFTLRAI